MPSQSNYGSSIGVSQSTPELVATISNLEFNVSEIINSVNRITQTFQKIRKMQGPLSDAPSSGKRSEDAVDFLSSLNGQIKLLDNLRVDLSNLCVHADGIV